jgi:transposase
VPSYDELLEENRLLKQQRQMLQDQMKLLQSQIDWLKKQVFGTGKSEKIRRDQMLLQLKDLEAAMEKSQAQLEKIQYERNKPRPKRQQAPAEQFKDLPVSETVEIEPEEVKAEPQLYERIGQEETFEVVITPPKLTKRQIIRPKYRHRLDRERPPVIAPAMKRPVEGGYASAELLAWVILSKYVDHQPLYRQEKMSERWGARIARQTMADWVEVVAEWLKPIYHHMRKDLLGGDYLQADETPIRCMDPDHKKGKTVQGWLWTISRPGGDVVFDWRMSRRHAEATTLLEGFAGVLQSDGYEAYQALARDNPGITRVGCWAHARRKFHEALREAPVPAGFVLNLMGHLFMLERKWDEDGFIDPSQRAHLRKRDFPIILGLLKKTARKMADRYRPQSGMGKACGYLLGQWEALEHVCHHGQSRIDNNLIENAIRPSALGKKNWLFIGHPQAGERSAILYSIVVSCQRQGIDPFAYLCDLLHRLPCMTNQNDLTRLLPSSWKPST